MAETATETPKRKGTRTENKNENKSFDGSYGGSPRQELHGGIEHEYDGWQETSSEQYEGRGLPPNNEQAEEGPEHMYYDEVLDKMFNARSLVEKNAKRDKAQHDRNCDTRYGNLMVTVDNKPLTTITPTQVEWGEEGDRETMKAWRKAVIEAGDKALGKCSRMTATEAVTYTTAQFAMTAFTGRKFWTHLRSHAVAQLDHTDSEINRPRDGHQQDLVDSWMIGDSGQGTVARLQKGCLYSATILAEADAKPSSDRSKFAELTLETQAILRQVIKSPPWQVVMAEQRQLQAAVKAAVVNGITKHSRGKEVIQQINAVGWGDRGAVEEIVDIDPVGHRVVDEAMTLLGWTAPTLGEVLNMIQAFTFGSKTSCGAACSWINKAIIESSFLESANEKDTARQVTLTRLVYDVGQVSKSGWMPHSTVGGKLEEIHEELLQVPPGDVENARQVLMRWHLKLSTYPGYGEKDGETDARVVTGYGAHVSANADLGRPSPSRKPTSNRKQTFSRRRHDNTWCRNCGLPNHHQSQCRYIAVCFYCKRPNHQSRDCPRKKAGQPPATRISDEFLKSNQSAPAEVSAAAAVNAAAATSDE